MKMQPDWHIETRLENKEFNSYYKGRLLTLQDYKENDFPYAQWKQDSRRWDECKSKVRYGDKIWTDNTSMDYAFDTVYNYINNIAPGVKLPSGSTGLGDFTALFPFEIYLLNDGFKFERIQELNAYRPSRLYIKGSKRIGIGFGLEYMGVKVTFYYTIPRKDNSRLSYFYLDNDLTNYEKCISGDMPTIWDLIDKQT